jgi:3-isopropylmalate dehydratase small subunit
VRAVIAESFERIHRSNLVGMGVLPLQFWRREAGGLLANICFRPKADTGGLICHLP